jgi:hypothetical protein
MLITAGAVQSLYRGDFINAYIGLRYGPSAELFGAPDSNRGQFGYDVGPVLTAAVSGGAGVARNAASRGVVTLYRAVSEAEALSIRSMGVFSVGPNSLGGKWFAETLQHAKQWGDVLNGPGLSRILEVTLPRSVADRLLRLKRLDGIGPARYGELDQLNEAVIREISP